MGVTPSPGATDLRLENPAGITRMPNGHFVVVDPDIEHSSSTQRESLWEIDLQAGRVVRSVDLTPLTSEPADVAHHPARGTFFVVDDDEAVLHEIERSGEPRSSVDLSEIGAQDPEGIAYAPELDRLFVADGRSRRILEITSEGKLVDRLELSELPCKSVEGIAWDPERQHLLALSDEPPAVFELTRQGELVAAHDLADLGAVRPQGITLPWARARRAVGRASSWRTPAPDGIRTAASSSSAGWSGRTTHAC